MNQTKTKGLATFITSKLEKSLNSVFRLLDQWANIITSRDVALVLSASRESWLLIISRIASGDQCYSIIASS